MTDSTADAILIIHMTPAESQPLGVFGIWYVRLRSDAERQEIALGGSISDMPTGAVVDQGEIHPPNGAPQNETDSGSPAIHTLQDAVDTAKAALANESSEIAKAGFLPTTPIYLWRKGKPAGMLHEEDEG